MSRVLTCFKTSLDSSYDELEFTEFLQEGRDVYVCISLIMVCSRCPRECRFYETILKKKCLKKLKNNVWENKTKWILIKKADCHLRMKLLYKYINIWMTYLANRYKKKINRRTTEAYYEERLKAKVVLALKRNVEQNRMLLRITKRKFEFTLKYRCWHQWKHYVHRRLKVREVKTLADRIREERLRIKFFYIWLFCLNEKRLLKDGYKLAAVKYESKLKEKCFKYWKIFTKKQICKTKIKKLAIACYKDKLKERYICSWKRYIYQKKQYRYQVSVIQNFYEKYVIKNYLNQWWITYRNLEYKNQIYNYNIAVNFYDKKLLEKGFYRLKKFRIVKKAKKEKMQKFCDIYIKIYLNFYLNVWVEKRTEKILWNILENKATEWREDYLREIFLAKLMEMYQERLEENEELENVIKYSNAIIIHRAFRGWREVTDNKMKKKFQLDNASKIYFEKLIKKSFDKWKKFVRKRSRKKMASEYYRFILLLRLMTQWKIFFKRRKLKLEEAAILEQRYKRKLMKNAFDCLKDEVELSKSKINAAIYFYDRSNLSKAFHKWKKNTRIKTVNKSRYTHNKAILNDIRVKNTIFQWYRMLSINQNVKKKLQIFKFRKEKRALGSYFIIWQKFVEKMKCVRQNVIAYAELKLNILIEQYLIILSEAVSNKKVFNKKKELAWKIEEKLLKRRYLRKWVSFICWKREKIRRCMFDERKFDSRVPCEFYIPVGKSARRQPMIPDYMKADFAYEHFPEEDTINQKTYRVECPVNKNIPVIDSKESFISFEI